MPGFEKQSPPSPDVNSAGDRLVSALNEFRAQFVESVRQRPNSEAEAVKALLYQAKKVVGESGLGAALAPTLLEEVKHWPTWSKRADFRQYAHFPAEDVSGSRESDDKKHEITKVYFLYNGTRYGVIFSDHGFKSGFEEPYHHGTVELVTNDLTVLGLDISLDIEPDFSQWRWYDLSAFRTGSWMKDLIEIAAHIEARSKQSSKDHLDNDALNRARNIEL